VICETERGRKVYGKGSHHFNKTWQNILYNSTTSEIQGPIAFISQMLFSFNLGCLHPVARVRSGDGGFYPSTQRHYRRIIYYLYFYCYFLLFY
jgi:hypothetical protein